MRRNADTQQLQSSTPACPDPSSVPSLRSIYYIYDLVEQRITSASASVATLLNYSVAEIEAIDSVSLASLIHPDDLDRVSDYYQQLTTLPYKAVISIDYRMKQANGNWCWLRSQETSLAHTVDGFPLQVVGVTLRLEGV